jgi:hypothetical protein
MSSPAARAPHPPPRAAPQDSPPTSALRRQRSMPKVKIAMDEMVSNLAATLSSTSAIFVMPMTTFPASSGRAKATHRRGGSADKYTRRCDEAQSLTHMCRALRGLLYGIPDAEHRRRQEIMTEEAKLFSASVSRAFGVAAGLMVATRKKERQDRHRGSVQKRREEVSQRRSDRPSLSLSGSTAFNSTTATDVSLDQASSSPRSRMQLLFSTPVNPGVPPRSITPTASSSLGGARPTTPMNAVSTPQGWIPSPSPIGRRNRHAGEGDSPVGLSAFY